MGMEGFAGRARRELVATGATARKRAALPARTPPGPAGEPLTGQEAQVARLAGTACRTQRSAPGCLSVPAPSSTTWARSSPSSVWGAWPAPPRPAQRSGSGPAALAPPTGQRRGRCTERALHQFDEPFVVFPPERLKDQACTGQCRPFRPCTPPDGFPLSVSLVEPGSVHDITAARGLGRRSPRRS
jgi:hypothetical protein